SPATAEVVPAHKSAAVTEPMRAIRVMTGTSVCRALPQAQRCVRKPEPKPNGRLFSIHPPDEPECSGDAKLCGGGDPQRPRRYRCQRPAATQEVSAPPSKPLGDIEPYVGSGAYRRVPIQQICRSCGRPNSSSRSLDSGMRSTN